MASSMSLSCSIQANDAAQWLFLVHDCRIGVARDMREGAANVRANDDTL